MSCLPAWEDAGKQPDYWSLVSGDTFVTSTLEGLREELGNEAVERFLAHYLGLLDERIIEIGRLMKGNDYEECVILLLTLETSSHMAGADELSLRAAALRLALGHRHSDTGVLYADLVRAASSTRELLAPR